ncbi:MAG: antitoxin [Myxococcaceae bacterium]|nr:antitoxin [Myxococcaceae bacterium]
MAAIKTSVSLDEHFDEYIRSQVASGTYATASEVVRDALRQHELETRKEAALLVRLDAAEASGVASITHEQAWAELLAKVKP